PEPGLRLQLGRDLDLSDTAIAKPSRWAGGPEPSTGFAWPRRGTGVFSVPAFLRLPRGVVANLGVEAARRELGVAAGKIGYVEGVGVLFNASHVLPIDARGKIPVRFHGPGGIPRIPAARFLEGRVSASEVSGKVVFVDPGLPGLAAIGTVAGPRTATEIQASLAANFLEGTVISEPGWGASLPVVLGTLCILLLALAWFLEFGATATFALAVSLGLAYPLIAIAVFLKASLWLPPELPSLMVAAAYLPFALRRWFAPAPPSRGRPQSIQPSAGYDPALISMPSLGRPSPATPAAASTPKNPMPGIPPTPRSPTPAGFFPNIPAQPPQPAVTEKPRTAPRERQGGPSSTASAAPSGEPPLPVSNPNATPDMPPAPAGAAADDIERDGKGGLVRVGKYRIVRKTGFGSGGDVFEGFDTHMGRKVAIKTITKNAVATFDRASERFVLEAKAAGSLNHPCINTIYDFGSIRDVSYMVLEYLDGITLSQWMRGHPVPPRPLQVAHWLQQVSSALDYAHGHKIIHRDLKPSNLMVVNDGATIKLLDFGIAKMEDVGLTQTGMTVGTPSYMSPEQLSGVKVGPASDQYGLAVVIYQLLTYKLPYIGTKIPELCNRILKNDIVPITDVDPSLGAPFWEALRKAMARTPEERYPNCLALFAALEAAFPNP
ncbi:MAG: protein kinase, partial [Fibrobacteria bacterium]